MPKYRNDNSYDATIGNYRIPAKGVLETKVCFPDSWLPDGVTRIADAPFYNPVILSVLKEGSAGGTDTIDIPEEVNGQKVERFKVAIHCLAGSVNIKFNVNAFSPVIRLEADESWQEPCTERYIEKIIVEYLETTSSVKIHVRRW